VAYVVAARGAQKPDAAALRRSLSKRLPEYMIPNLFVVLEDLPLTPSGKLDRRALPAPGLPDRPYRAPRTPDEEVLCSLFAEVLQVPKVGMDDNFFSLGGHSLLATRLVARIRPLFGIELPVRMVFEYPQVSDLSRELNRLWENEIEELTL